MGGKHSGPKVVVGAVQGLRDSMEDCHSVVRLTKHSDVLFIGIYDGHGGRGAAEFCKKKLHKFVDERLHGGNGTSVLKHGKEALYQAFLHLDGEWIKRCNEVMDFSGSTAVVCIIDTVNQEMVVANAGDAECVLSRGGTAMTLSQMHKPAKPDEKKRIEKAGHKVILGRVDGSLAVSRAIGDFAFKLKFELVNGILTKMDDPDKPTLRPEDMACSPCPFIHKIKLHPNDEFIVLGCDGLFDVMDAQEIVNWVRRHFNKKQFRSFTPNTPRSADYINKKNQTTQKKINIKSRTKKTK